MIAPLGWPRPRVTGTGRGAAGVEGEAADGNHAAFSHPGLVEFFTSGRCRPQDLYPSERRFLPWLAGRARTVLDVGCAAGGFAGIWESLAPGVSYTGTDVSPELIEVARETHPDRRFEVADAVGGLPFDDRSFDVVQALGWMHWEPRYREAMAELWRLTAGSIFFDVRLRPPGAGSVLGRQRLAYGSDEWDGSTDTPYLVVDLVELVDDLLVLCPARILAYGYLGQPDDLVVGIDGEVCFTTVVLERGDEDGDGSVVIAAELPWPVPERDGVVHVTSLSDLVLDEETSAEGVSGGVRAVSKKGAI